MSAHFSIYLEWRIMAVRENLVAMVLFAAFLTQGTFAAAHCFEVVSAPNAAHSFVSSHDDDHCDSRLESLNAVVTLHDSIEAVPAGLVFAELISQVLLPSRRTAPALLASAFFSPPLSMNSILRI